MTSSEYTCPHCGGQHSRVLSDRLGSVGWCDDCHRVWIISLGRLPAPPQRSHTPEPQRRIA